LLLENKGLNQEKLNMDLNWISRAREQWQKREKGEYALTHDTRLQAESRKKSEVDQDANAGTGMERKIISCYPD